MLFINPHLDFFGPTEFYEGHLHSEQGWNLSGASRCLAALLVAASLGVAFGGSSILIASPASSVVVAPAIALAPDADPTSSVWVEETTDPQAAAEALVSAANEAGGRDNISVVVVEVMSAARADAAGTASEAPPALAARLRDGAWSALGLERDADGLRGFLR